ncbi:hypothetical protein JN535_04250 [Cellulosimicrobium cellulans]|uniref:hypothetical protein n=1 Tax=Cellulosimicrobium cellulans TaxID=1710 RepID=UPI00196329F1|nr:hypothetical protein [Cellulosimicrobium cellulans]MBN0039386.1 hypothetical protein [Cellulosimicrobium cellulans]
MKFYLPILSTIEQAAQDGLRAAGDALLEESNSRAPENLGDLKEAGEVQVEDLTVAVTYQTPKRAGHKNRYPYIARQHEDMTYEHEGGGPKFLESAGQDMRGELAQILAAKIREELGG